VSELTPRAREIVEAAQALLEEEGPDALTMRRLAERLGIKAPSIYKHVPDKRALEVAMIAAGFEEIAERFEAADGIDELATAWRSFARGRPHLYRLMTLQPLPRDRLPAGVEARAALPVVAAAGGDEHLGRALFAFAHGMTILELDERFPEDADLDAAWAAGLAALTERP
jgi:AcrR family transcriptional regulator